MCTYLCVCSAGAFKTLDKDNSGSIDLDIKEVKQFSSFHYLFLSLNSQYLPIDKGVGLVSEVLCAGFPSGCTQPKQPSPVR